MMKDKCGETEEHVCEKKDKKLEPPQCQPEPKKKAKPPKSENECHPKPTTGGSGHGRPILEFPHFLRIIGPKQIKIFMSFVPSAITYSVTSLILVTYITDWKAVLQYLPYYNGKYVENKTAKPEEDEE